VNAQVVFEIAPFPKPLLYIKNTANSCQNEFANDFSDLSDE